MMTVRGLGYALSVSIAAALLACCGPLPLTVRQAQGNGQNGMEPPMGSPGRAEWSTRGEQKALLYVSSRGEGENGFVGIYSYPGARRVSMLSNLGSPEGLCVDKSGDLYVADIGPPGHGFRILEYVRGAPLRREIQERNEGPYGCAIDPATGNLAVTNNGGYQGSNVSVYLRARGTAQQFFDSAMKTMYFCGYDDHGNLYVDGETNFSGIEVAELPKGGKNLVNIGLSESIGTLPGGVQWDGEYLAVGGNALGTREEVIYRIAVRGSSGTVIGSVPLTQSVQSDSQFWIEGSTVIAPSFRARRPRTASVGFYPYPAGGSPTKIITHRLNAPLGVAVIRPSQ
jgi:hypothetical protein